MSAVFGNLKKDGLEESEDRIGGGGFNFDTDIYLATVKAAYAGASAGGAQSVTLLLTIGEGKDAKEYRETIYVTNRKGENWFLNKDDKTKKVPLPGFTIIDDLCMMTTDAPLAEQEAEEKVINVYDFEHKKEMPKAVPMLTALLGKQAYVGIVKNLENKTEKQGDEYVAIADTRETNNIEKIFHYPSKLTMVEARNGADEAKFFDSWSDRNKGNTRDKRSIKDGEGGSSSKPGSGKAPPQAGSSSGGARKSLFGS